MKPLDKLSIVEKGKLLHELFPTDIVSFIVFAKRTAENFLTYKEHIEKTWTEQSRPTTFEYWLSLVENAKSRFDKYETAMVTRSGLFADQLFDGHDAFFAIDSLQKFAESDKCTNPNMVLAIHMFFL